MKKILIIDDEIDVRETLSKALKLNDERYEIVCADDGQSGLETARKFRPDLILLDILLPDLNGTDVCRFLKNDEEYKSIQIIMLTALDQSKDIVKGLSSGADDYVCKPFNMPELLARVTSHLKMKELYEKVKASERKYDTLVQSLPDVVYKLDMKGNFVFISDSVKKMGFEPQKIIGKHFSKIIHPDDVPLVSRTIVLPKYVGKTTGDYGAPKLFDERRSKERATRNLEFRLAPKERSEGKFDSEGLKVMITIAYGEVASAGQYDSESKKTLGTVGVIRDITERKQAEEELHRLGKAIEHADEIIIIADIDGNIQYVNPAFNKITGYKKKEVIGQNPRIWQSGKQDKLFYNKMWDTLTQGKVWSGHFINKKKDGTLFEEDATISPVFDNSGKMINYVAVKRDVTKEIMLESQLRQSQKLEALGTLAGGIAHDFNNILTAIIGYTEFSIDSLPGDSEISKNLNQVIKSSERARDLVKQIVTFSRQVEKELKPLELGPVVKEVLKLIKASLPSTIEIKSNIDKKPGIVIADLTQMHQLIMNLCVNAEYAMREKGGILEVNLDSVNVDANLTSTYINLKEGPYIKLTVRDTGHGMNKKITERIFDPFFTTKKAGEGTGMGLTTVYGIVLYHGGEITIHSEPGEETTFEVYLPSADTTATKENLKNHLMPRGNERVLLVEDEEAVLDVEQKILENLGYEVVAKDNSLEALETFKADPKGFDIVITDQTMPDMTGDVLTRELMRVRHDIPVILCTGFSHLITKEKAKTIGIRKFIMKPFNVRDIAVAIRETLEKE